MSGKSQTVSTGDTRERIRAVAKRQFAAVGFYGASLADIAEDLGLTKQAVLYHFRRKEDLYAEVLRDISERLMRYLRQALARDEAPEAQLETALLGLYHLGREAPEDRQLLLRELLDNRSRAKAAKHWYLVEFVDGIVTLVRATAAGRRLGEPAAMALAYQLLGGIEYFLASEATLRRMYGAAAYEAMADEFPVALRARIREGLAAVG